MWTKAMENGHAGCASTGFSMGSPEPDTSGSVSSHSLVSPEVDSMDWFMNLTTPSTPTFDNLGEDLFSLPTSELAHEISQGATPKEMPLPERAWAGTYPQALEIGSASQASRTRQDSVSSIRGLDAVDPMLQVITTAVPGPLSVNALPTPVALQRGQDAGDRPQTPVSLALDLSNRYKDKEARGQDYDGERRQLLFPALTQLDRDAERSRPRFDPCVSPLIAQFSKARVDEAARQTAVEAISFIMSQECQRSLPGAWWLSGLGQQTARDIGWADLPIQSLIRMLASVKLYLEQREVLAAVNFLQPSFRSQAAAVGRCIVVTLAAWGSLLKPDQRKPDTVELIARMGEAYDGLNAEPDSVDKFLAIVAVLQLVHKLGLKHLPKLLATAVSIIQALSLHSAAALQSLCAESPGLAARVKRACWIVFCVDKVNALRWKSFSLLPEPCLQYTPPPMEDCNSNQDWLLAQCRYSKLCGQIYNETSHAREDQSRSSESKATSIAAELEDWYGSLPDDGRLHDKNTTSRSLARQLAICMLYQYCEAKLALLDVDDTWMDTTKNPPLRSPVIPLSRDIFKFSNRIEPDDIVYDRILLFLPSLSLCKMATQVSTHGSADFEDARAVLAVAHGFFARMSSVLPTTEFFDRVTELVDIAVRAHKSVKKTASSSTWTPVRATPLWRILYTSPWSAVSSSSLSVHTMQCSRTTRPKSSRELLLPIRFVPGRDEASSKIHPTLWPESTAWGCGGCAQYLVALLPVAVFCISALANVSLNMTNSSCSASPGNKGPSLAPGESLLLASIPSHTETACASASPLLSSAAVVCGIVKLALTAANRWFGGGVDRTTPAQSGVNVNRELEGSGWTSCRPATCALVATTKASIPAIAEANAKPSKNEITTLLLWGATTVDVPAAEHFRPSSWPPSALSGGGGMASYRSLWLRIAL
ncbi:hypothetical protein M406DRAFT_329199 [Cryphonectria parasitica EP155]|uniref:Transcription factor domain-containing protein n=1 Tax=Cryphonectria parasitica (strain ATCC 38755 / EP155) TaxID=660469 RepID=A0A9P4Y1K6_CRYP1|nr:uncharacterized protein M406DRAFT_329199 [Cryphonectria parasitica EP155]KAF3765277.1 hypothetical protein M406DRAFT_329199 [Cryphonectria parasitica EP155]